MHYKVDRSLRREERLREGGKRGCGKDVGVWGEGCGEEGRGAWGGGERGVGRRGEGCGEEGRGVWGGERGHAEEGRGRGEKGCVRRGGAARRMGLRNITWSCSLHHANVYLKT